MLRRTATRLGLGCLALAVGLCAAAAAGSGSPRIARAGFAVQLGAELWPYRIASASLLPGELLRLRPRGGDGPLELSASGGSVVRVGEGGWGWAAPRDPGLAVLELRRASGEVAMRIHAFVMVPADDLRDGALNGYRMGDYPPRPAGDPGLYEPPTGFVEVTPGLESVPVSPHFRLGDFLCKQEGAYPKYLALRGRLLLGLEAIVEALGRDGAPGAALRVMSGYRTPDYNRELGNVPRSRHLWGDAADIFVDAEPRDGRMDDLNGDGRVDVLDARWLADRIEAMPEFRREWPFAGGLAVYDANPAHGPFVHLDLRGERRRWGH